MRHGWKKDTGSAVAGIELRRRTMAGARSKWRSMTTRAASGLMGARMCSMRKIKRDEEEADLVDAGVVATGMWTCPGCTHHMQYVGFGGVRQPWMMTLA
ncbi:hypothetical protein ACFX1Q_010629 [Malus domestica]